MTNANTSISPNTINAPEVESRGYRDAKRGRSNPYACNTGDHASWELGRMAYVEMERQISEELGQPMR